MQENRDLKKEFREVVMIIKEGDLKDCLKDKNSWECITKKGERVE